MASWKTPVKNVHHGVTTVSMLLEEREELFLTATASDGENWESLFQRVNEALQISEAAVVSQEVFGDTARGMTAFRKVFGEVRWPLTWIEQPPGQERRVIGTQVWAVHGTTPTRLRVNGRVLGSVLDFPEAQVCRLGGLLPEDQAASDEDQAYSVFQVMQSALETVEMDFSEVLRTWFYNRDILDWYGEFNKARSRFFEERNVFDGLVPASTGIAGFTNTKAALCGELVAVQPKEGWLVVQPVPSPLQCPALAYGSAFSRAVEYSTPRHKRIWVSGTASIAPEGHTVHLGDTKAQTELTLDVVDAILKSRGFEWQGVSRALCYVKYAEEIPLCREVLKGRGLADMPAIYLGCDVCRDDLLFEIELDALMVME